MTLPEITSTVLDFVRQHPNWAAFVVFALSFGESLSVRLACVFFALNLFERAKRSERKSHGRCYQLPFCGEQIRLFVDRYQNVDLTVSNDVEGGFEITGGVRTGRRRVVYRRHKSGEPAQAKRVACEKLDALAGRPQSCDRFSRRKTRPFAEKDSWHVHNHRKKVVETRVCWLTTRYSSRSLDAVPSKRSPIATRNNRLEWSSLKEGRAQWPNVTLAVTTTIKFQVTMGNRTMTFDSFECAIQAMAPECSACGWPHYRPWAGS